MARSISARVQNPTIKVGGSPLRDATFDALVDVRVERELQLPAAFSMRFRDPSFDLLDSGIFTIAKPVTIAFPDASGTDVTVLSGEITAIGVEQGGGDRHELVISGLDAGHRLAHSGVPTTYLKASAIDALRTVAGRVGLSLQTSLSGPKQEHLVQTGSDYAFVDDLARRLGADWWVEDQKLHVAARKSGSPVVVRWGDDLLRFKMRVTAANQSGKVTVRGWNPREQKAITATDGGSAGSPDAAQLGSTATLATSAASARSNLKGYSSGVVATAVRAGSAEEASALAKAFGEEVAGDIVVAKGEALGHPELTVGRKVEVKDMGSSLSGHYLVTEVTHIWGAGRLLTTRFGTGAKHPTSLVDLLGGKGAAPSPFSMPLVGVVTSSADPETLGRVKVKLPTLGDNIETDWARVASAGGGGSTGLMLIPQPGDEVLVAFESGDSRFPVVLGGLWSAKQKPPTAAKPVVKDGKTTRALFLSRKGHLIEVADGDGDDDQHLLLKLASGTALRVGKDKVTIEVANNRPFEVKTGQASIAMSDRGDITISGNNVTIKANQKLVLEGTAEVGVTSKANLKLMANVKAELTGNASTAVSGNGMLELKGGMVKIN